MQGVINRIYSDSLWERGLLLLEALPVDFTAQRPQPCRGLFGRDIPLRLSQQLVTHEKLAHSCGAQERRIEVHVEVAVLGFFLCTIEGRLVDPRAWSC